MKYYLSRCQIIDGECSYSVFIPLVVSENSTPEREINYMLIDYFGSDTRANNTYSNDPHYFVYYEFNWSRFIRPVDHKEITSEEYRVLHKFLH